MMRMLAPLAAFVLLAASLAAAELRPPDSNLFKKSSLQFHADTNAIKRGKLVKPATIQNMPCRRYVWFYPSGALEQFEAAEAVTLNGIDIPSKSFVFLREDGTLDQVWFSKDVVIDGVPCNGGWGKIDVEFHPNGKLKLCFLSKDALIQNIPCEASLFRPVIFDNEGRLIRATLSQDHTIGGKTFKKGDELAFDENANARLYEKQE